MLNLSRSYPCFHWDERLRTLGCACPVTVDPYQGCTYKCLYCPSHYAVNWVNGSQQYKEPIIHSLREKEFRQIVGGTFYGNPPADDAYYSQFIPYILARLPLNMGHIADPFIPEEAEFKVTLAILRMCHEMGLPLSIATKSAWWTQEKYRYMEVMEMHAAESHRKIVPWVTRISCSSLDPVMDKIDLGAPPANDRLKAIRRLSERDVIAYLWLRPFIPGISNDWPDLFEAAAAEGAKGVIVQWLDLPRGAGKAARARYEEMSRLANYDVFEYYRDNSPKSDQTMRLTAQAKRPIMEQMRERAHKLGMKFIVSGPHCRDLSDAKNCCGLPDEMTPLYSAPEAIKRFDGPAGWGNFERLHPIDLKNLLATVEMQNTGLLTDKEKKVPGMSRRGLYRVLHDYWNAPEAKDSLMNLYGAQPSGRDKNGDCQYTFGGATKDVQRIGIEEKAQGEEVDEA